jgi:hypothetical protein
MLDVCYYPKSGHCRKQLMPRPNWSRPLPRPLTIPTVMDLVTLADVRELLGHLPKETRAKSTWQHVEAELKKAAAPIRATWQLRCGWS